MEGLVIMSSENARLAVQGQSEAVTAAENGIRLIATPAHTTGAISTTTFKHDASIQVFIPVLLPSDERGILKTPIR